VPGRERDGLDRCHGHGRHGQGRQAPKGGDQCTGTDGKCGLPGQTHGISLLVGSHTGTAAQEAVSVASTGQSGTNDANIVTRRCKEEAAEFHRTKR
jgi:hypothetical protein